MGYKKGTTDISTLKEYLLKWQKKLTTWTHAGEINAVQIDTLLWLITKIEELEHGGTDTQDSRL